MLHAFSELFHFIKPAGWVKFSRALTYQFPVYSMSSNEGYHNRIEPGAGGDDRPSGSGSDSAGGSARGSTASASQSKQLHEQMLNETTYLKPSKQAYFSDEKVLIPDDESVNVSDNNLININTIITCLFRRIGRFQFSQAVGLHGTRFSHVYCVSRSR